MASSASAILDLIAPQFSADANKSDFISLANDRTNICYYGTNANQAIALRAAHMMTLRDRNDGNDAGARSSKKEGDLAVGFSVGGGKGDLDQTHYGKQLKGLRKASGAAIGVTGGRDNGCI